jgi:bifunctional DNase/RNase
VVSARPSDAIALAVRTGASVFVAEEVVEQAGYLPPPTEEPMAAAQVEEFRAFLDSVEPEDFEG